MYRGGMFNNAYMRSKHLPASFYVLAIGMVAFLFAIGTFLAYYNHMVGGDVADINLMLKQNNNYLESSEITKKTICSVEICSAYGSFTARDRNQWTRGERTYTYYIGRIEEDNSIFFIKTSSQKERELLNQITSETMNSDDHKSKQSIVLEGSAYEQKIGNPPKEYERMIKRLGLEGEGSNVKVRYLCIDTSYSRSRLWGRTIICFIIGVLCLFGQGILHYIKKKAELKAKQMEEQKEAARRRAEEEERRRKAPEDGPVDIDEIKRKLNYDFETGEYKTPGSSDNGSSNKISISGRDIFTDR